MQPRTAHTPRRRGWTSCFAEGLWPAAVALCLAATPVGAAAPDFASSGHVFIYYSPAGAAPENRLSRFTLRGDALDLSSEKIVLRVAMQSSLTAPDTSRSHNHSSREI